MRRMGMWMLVLCLITLVPAGVGAGEKVVTLRASVPTPPTSVPTKALVRFADAVEKKSGGALKIRVFHSGQLGTDREGIESARMGTLDIEMTGTGVYSSLYPNVQILDLPFLFRDAAHAKEIITGPIGDEIFRDLPKYNLVHLSTGDNGMRHLSTASRAVRKVEDVKGLKIRVPENPIYTALWRDYGAVVVPLPIAELYMALKTGVVDGQDNAPYHVVANKVYEVQKYYSMINYMWMGLTTVMNLEKFKRLPAEHQKLLLDEARDMAVWTFGAIEEDNKTAIETMRKAGIEVIMNPDQDSFKRNMKAFYQRYEKEPWYSQAIIDKIQGAK